MEVRARRVIVSGARPTPPRDSLLWCERPRGRFERVLELPGDAALDRLEARLEDGVLRLEVPRSAGLPHRSVSVG